MKDIEGHRMDTGQLFHQWLEWLLIFLAPFQLYLMADMALIVLISLLHFYLLYKAEAEAEADGECCSGCAVLSASGLFICAICLSARQLITFVLPSFLLHSPSLLLCAYAVLALSAFHRPLA